MSEKDSPSKLEISGVDYRLTEFEKEVARAKGKLQRLEKKRLEMLKIVKELIEEG